MRMNVSTIISMNMAENDGGSQLQTSDYQLAKNKFLRRQYHGFIANVKYASKNFIRDDKPATIHFVFSDKKDMNAYASRLRIKESTQYLIVCYTGFFTHVLNLFTWLMSFESVLPVIRAKRKRSINAEHLSGLFVKDGHIDLAQLTIPYVLAGPDAMDSMTKDIRNEYALLLTSLGIEFLFFHEMTHIDHGHIDYLKSRNVKFDTLYNMDGLQKKGVEKFKNIKGLEFEADLGAAEYLFDSYWNLAYKGTLMKKFSRLLKTNDDLMFAVAYSLIWLFHLIQDYRMMSGKDITDSHPTPGCRILAIFRIFCKLGEQKNGDIALIYTRFIKAAEEYLQACHLLAIHPYLTPEIFYQPSEAEEELIRADKLRLDILADVKPNHFGRRAT